MQNPITHFPAPDDAHRIFFERNPLPMYLHDIETLAILEVNHAAVEHYGYSRDEFLTLNLLDIRPETEHAALKKIVFEPWSGLSNAGVWTHRKKSGELLLAQIHFGQFSWKGRQVRLVVVHDVTAQHSTEAALRASEERFRVVVETVPDFIIMIDRDSRVLFINRLLPGYRMEDVIGTPSYNFIDPAYHDIHRKALEIVFEKGESFTYEVQGSGVPGEWRWYLNRVTPLKRDGAIIAATQIATDITERRRVEEAMRESEARFRALMEGIPGLILLLDRNLRIQFVNTPPPGLQREDLLGAGAESLIAQSSRDAYRRLVERTIDSGSGGSLELLANHGIEGERWFEVRTRPLRAASGETQALVIGIDIDSRRRAEAQLRESREFIERFGLTAPYVIYVYDLDTKQTMWMNRKFTSELGYTEEQLARGEATLDKLMHPEDLARIPEWSKRWENATDRTVMQTEYRLRHVEGSWRNYLDRGSVFMRNADGRVTQIIGSVEDITERKQLEEQLRQSQKLDSIGRLAGGIAHDFNNLLTSILGHLEMAEQHLPPNSVAIADLEVIRLAAQRSADLTSQLLSFARKQIVQPRLVNLNELVRETQRLLLRVIGENIDMIAAPHPNLGLTKIDPGQLTQVLINLSVNARDAMPGGGKLTISTGHATIKTAQASPELPAGEYVTLSVTDTGTGMTASVRSHLFEPFFTTKGVGQGTGLGLATCYGIVKQAQGDIQVQTEVGQGTTFTLFLPRADSGTPVMPEIPRLSNTVGSETILVVEDDEMLLKLTSRFLTAQGYTVLSAHDAAMAERLAEEFAGKIALLLTDMVMPRTSGLQLATALYAKRPGLRVLLMTGYTDESLAGLDLPQSATALLQKPFTLPVLSNSVRELLDRKP